MEAQRALLDQLMGKDRNERLDAAPRPSARARKFYDPEVDKHYLVGCSPYELLRNTKTQLREEGGIADDECKRQWDALPDEEKARYGYEEDTLQLLRRLVSKRDRHVATQLQRVMGEDETFERDVDRIVEIELRSREIADRVPVLAKQGLVAQAFALDQQLAGMQRSKEDLCKVPQSKFHQFVCPVTAQLIARADNDQRILCYLEGRCYKGWLKIRETLAQLLAKSRVRPLYSSRPPSSQYGRGRDYHYRVDRDRDRRERERRSRSHDRKDRRDRSHDRSHDRSRDRSHDRSRDRRDRARRSRSRGRKDRDRKERKRHRRSRSESSRSYDSEDSRRRRRRRSRRD